KINPAEIAAHTAHAVGSAGFGVPRIDAKYGLSEMPISAVRAHVLVLLDRFRQIQLPWANLMLAFGAVAQGLAPIAAGEHTNVQVNTAMPRLDIARLYMEAAVPMSKLDLRKLGMVD